MNLSEAISLFEERCESPIDVAALECIRAALVEVQKPDVQHTQPAKCRECYHWAPSVLARCVRGGGDQCAIRGGTQQAGA